MSRFDDLPVIGALPPDRAAAKLRELGDETSAAALESAVPHGTKMMGGLSELWPFRDKPWQHTAHAFGYLGPGDPGTASLPIRPVGTIEADETLRNARVNITLKRSGEDPYRVTAFTISRGSAPSSAGSTPPGDNAAE